MTDVLTGLSVLLRCPVTGQQLHIATPEELQTLSDQLAEGFLIREDGQAAYPVNNGIPGLLPESIISLST